MFNILLELLGWFEEHVTGERPPERKRRRPRPGRSEWDELGETCERCGQALPARWEAL